MPYDSIKAKKGDFVAYRIKKPLRTGSRTGFYNRAGYFKVVKTNAQYIYVDINDTIRKFYRKDGTDADGVEPTDRIVDVTSTELQKLLRTIKGKKG